MGGTAFAIILVILAFGIAIAAAVGRSSVRGSNRSGGYYDSNSANNYGMGWTGSSDSGSGGNGGNDCGPSYSDNSGGGGFFSGGGDSGGGFSGGGDSGGGSSC